MSHKSICQKLISVKHLKKKLKYCQTRGKMHPPCILSLVDVGFAHTVHLPLPHEEVEGEYGERNIISMCDEPFLYCRSCAGLVLYVMCLHLAHPMTDNIINQNCSNVIANISLSSHPLRLPMPLLLCGLSCSILCSFFPESV